MPRNPAKVSEQSYIFVSNLTRVREMLATLRMLDAQPEFISADEISTVGAALGSWLGRMERAQGLRTSNAQFPFNGKHS